MVAVRKHLRGREALLLNHNRGNLKGRKCYLPARAISTKNKHLLISLRCQPAVSRRLFRCFEAHLPRSP
jgi:hypothetical protein